MAEFKKSVITEKGLALIQKTQMREIKLEFAYIRTGAGVYDESEDLKNITALKDVRQEFKISSIAAHDEKTTRLSTAITNEELQQGYFIGEIAVYAVDPDEGEILYSISVTYPGKADYLPAYNGNAPVRIYLDTYQAVSDSANVTIHADTGAYALAKDLEELQKTIELLKEQISAGSFGSKVLIGPADTPLDKGDTLFIVEGIPEAFRAAAFTNVSFGEAPQAGAEYWADMEAAGESDAAAGVSIINGKLAVSSEQDAPKDAAFLAKI